MPESKSRSYLILGLAFFSGFAGLLQETLWRRALGASLGATPAATATVLAAFMLGLALGAAFLGPRADRAQDPARLYALLEVGLAALSLPVLFLLLGASPLVGFLWRHLNEVLPFFGIVRFLVCFAVVALPAALMGGTLPVMVRIAATADAKSAAQGAARLYLYNTLGAFLGCLTAGFFLLERLGLVGTALLAAVLNAGAGLAALRFLGKPWKALGRDDFVRDWSLPSWSGLDPRLALAFTGGFSALALEVGYERALLLLFGASPYAFTVMLGAALSGISAGAWAASKVLRSSRVSQVGAPLVLAGAGLSTLLSLALASGMDRLHPALVDLFGVSSWGAWAALALLESLLILGPPFVLFGALFPLVAAMKSREGKRGEDFGMVSAANTLGAVLGALSAGFVLMPVLGTTRTVALAGILAMGTATVLALESWTRDRMVKGGGLLLCGLAFVLGPALVPADLLVRRLRQGEPGKRLLYLREGPTGTVSVESYPDRRTLSVDGVNVAGTTRVLRTTQKFQAHLPALFAKENPRVLQVGFGSGETARALALHHPTAEDLVEINPGVVEAARTHFADIGGGAMGRLFIMDAAQYMRVSRDSYDLILNDSIHPSLNGNAALYARDYFEACRKRLNPGGVLSSWVPLFGLGLDDLRMIIRDFTRVFPEALLFVPHGAEPRHALLLGWKAEGVPAPDIVSWRKRFAHLGLRRDLAGVGLDSVDLLLDSFITGGPKLREFAAGSMESTTLRPRLEFTASRVFGDDRLILGRNLQALLEIREPVYAYLSLPGDLEACRRVERDLDSYFQSSGLMLKALADKFQGRPQGVEDRLVRAGEMEPRNPAPRFFLAEAGKERQSLKQRAAESPAGAQGRFELGRSYWQGGDPGRAEGEFRAALSAEPEFFEARLSLGHLHAIAGRWDEAKSDYLKALGLAPESLIARRGLCQVQVRLGDGPGALETAKLIVRQKGAGLEDYNQLASLASQAGDEKAAKTALDQALALDPRNARTLNNLGIFYHREAKYEEALNAFRRAAEADPGQKETYANFATAALRSGALGDAEEACRKALELDPSWAFAQALLGAALHAQGHDSEARAAWQRALELDPAQPQARDWLEEAAKKEAKP